MVNKEFGSYFYLDDNNNNKDDSDSNFIKEYNYFSTCRSAISLILQEINPTKKVALLPAFTCHAVVEPFIKSGYEVYPYSINKDFTTDSKVFINEVNKVNPTVVLIHDYFGFDTNKDLRDKNITTQLLNSGITVINDKTQSMFSSYENIKSKYVVGSIRKWMGIPDGAFSDIDYVCHTQDEELVLSKLAAMEYKRDYITKGKGIKENILGLYKKAETILDSREQAYKMSDVSVKILKKADIGILQITRRRNYEVLSENINSGNILIPYKTLKQEEVPFYFPIFVKEKRKEFQKYLAENNIYATIIWGCPEEFAQKINSNAYDIYSEILCVPCDQRYNEEDMKYIAHIINSFDFSKG